MCAFATDFDRAKAGYSPDRMDALVWALTELMLNVIPHVSIVAPIIIGANEGGRYFPESIKI